MNNTMKKTEWEDVTKAGHFEYAEWTSRIKVEGGFLYRNAMASKTGISSSLCFVPDLQEINSICWRCDGITSENGICDICGRKWGKGNPEYNRGYNAGWKDAGKH